MDEKEFFRMLGDIPHGEFPFSEVAQRHGVPEAEVIARILDLRNRGLIRRFGAVLRHQQAGFGKNALVVWAVPDEKVESVGGNFSRHREISHCYERKPAFLGKYNLFTMVHFGKSKPEDILTGLSHESGSSDYQVLWSEEEYKKTSFGF